MSNFVKSNVTKKQSLIDTLNLQKLATFLDSIDLEAYIIVRHLNQFAIQETDFVCYSTLEKLWI